MKGIKAILAIGIILLLLALLVLSYLLTRHPGIPSSTPTITKSGSNTTGYNASGYNTTGYNSSGVNAIIPTHK